MSNFRSQKLLDLAKEAPCCMYCGAHNHGQVVGCHSNSQRHGKGQGLKAHDVVAYLCDECHRVIDGAGAREYREWMFLEAVYQTTLWLLQSGHLRVA